jgi:hypothetical protein
MVGGVNDLSAGTFKVKANLIPRIDCRKGFKDYMKNKKVRAFNGAKHPKCFDLNSKHAVIGGENRYIIL